MRTSEEIAQMRRDLKQAQKEYADDMRQQYIDQVNYYQRERAHQEKSNSNDR